MSQNILIFASVLFSFFFGISGMYAIVQALKNPDKHNHESSVETTLVKFKAPISFIYGIFAIGLVFVIIKYNGYMDQTAKIQILKLERDSLDELNQKLLISGRDSLFTSIKVNIRDSEAKSIFAGKILIELKQGNIKFTGITGISRSISGPFKNSETEARRGERFYLMTENNMLWGVNILADYPEVIMEMFKWKT